MLLIYGGYTMTAAITGQSGAGAAFLTSSSALFDGRSGSGCSIKWTNGTQNTSSFVTITVTVTANPFGEATPRIGGAGLINVQGMPVNMKTIIGGVTQRLVAGARGELSAWTLPFSNSTTFTVQIFNDNGAGGSPIVAAATIAIGEIIAGRILNLKTLIYNAPSRAIQDPTAFQRSSGGQLWQLMRKPWWQVGATGRFSTTDAKGGTTSTIGDGGNPGGKIDIQTLSTFLATTPVCAICDVAHNGVTYSNSNGITYNQSFMQQNWMLARQSAAGSLTLDNPPMWTWSPTYQEAT